MQQAGKYCYPVTARANIMFRFSPKESVWVSWLYVALCTIVIYGTIPFARVIQKFIDEQYGRQFFFNLTLTCIIITIFFLVVYLLRIRTLLIVRKVLWLLTAGGVWIYSIMQFKHSPEETLHFIEYGLVGLLLYRALMHHVKDPLIYPCAVLVGIIIGILDEIIQWITPGRYWHIRDVFINSLSVFLMQVTISMGIQPAAISYPIKKASLRLVCRLSIAVLILLGLCLSNTPQNVMWYADRIPGLKFLKKNENMMTEYGYRHIDPDIGTFYSRFTLRDIYNEDKHRYAEVAAIIDSYQGREGYKNFLKTYTPAVDPFAHEVRVRLFRRNYYLKEQADYNENDDQKYDYCTIAYKEHQLIRKYFSATLLHSAYMISDETIDYLRARLNTNTHYVSKVSMQLITSFSKKQILVIIAALLIILFFIDRYYCRCVTTEKSKT